MHSARVDLARCGIFALRLRAVGQGARRRARAYVRGALRPGHAGRPEERLIGPLRVAAARHGSASGLRRPLAGRRCGGRRRTGHPHGAAPCYGWAGRWPVPRPALLRLPGFPRFACSAMLNTVAFAGEQVVLGWLVLDLTNSPLLVGVALALRMAPLLVVGLPAGVLADRGDRLVLLRGANTTMALALTAARNPRRARARDDRADPGSHGPHRLRARAPAGDAAGPHPRPGRRRATDRGARASSASRCASAVSRARSSRAA